MVGVFTCFDVPDVEFPTAGHPWSTDPKHQDIADKKLLNQRVRFYGDDIAAVVAENDVAASFCHLISHSGMGIQYILMLVLC